MSTLSTEANSRVHLPVPSFPDPNAQQNRAPGNIEMATLRRISEYNARAIRLFDEEIEQHQKTYNTLRNRYLRQQLELEVTQSELNRIRDFISASEAQRAVHEAEQRDLLALMHPVRRCPDEILHEIFQCIIRETTFAEKPLRQSFQLSSVCQKWRAVAIGMPLLWTKVEFDLHKSPDILKHQQQTIVSRIKGAPAKIHILTIEHHSGEQLAACGLKMFPFIGDLVLTLANSESIRPLLQSISPLYTGRVRNMRIQSRNTPSTLKTLDQPLVIGSDLLGQFPGLTSAVFSDLSNFDFRLRDVNLTLTKLAIHNANHFSIIATLCNCPKLEWLQIRNTRIGGGGSGIVGMSLRYLELANIKGDTHTWMKGIRFPKLETLALFIQSVPASLALISSNRSIKTLFCKESATDIVTIAPQLVTLHVLPPLEVLCTPLPPSWVAFPFLEHLFINMTSLYYQITMGEFDMLVRTRCLPVGHPESLAKQSSQILSSLILALPIDLQPQEWQQSKFYKESTRSEFFHIFYGRNVMRLTWPVKNA